MDIICWTMFDNELEDSSHYLNILFEEIYVFPYFDITLSDFCQTFVVFPCFFLKEDEEKK